MTNLVVGAVLALTVAKVTYEGLWLGESWVAWDRGLAWLARSVAVPQEFPRGVRWRLAKASGSPATLEVVVQGFASANVIVTLRRRSDRKVVARGYSPRGRTTPDVLVFDAAAAGSYTVEVATGTLWYGEQLGFGAFELPERAERFSPYPSGQVILNLGSEV